jgi:LAO/AO transport system kinase
MQTALSDPQTLAAKLRLADRQAVAEALNLIDDQRPAARAKALELLAALEAERLANDGHLIGITGPPGAGKSSLLSALIDYWCAKDLKVAVLAVDPSSPKTGGALLGDRLRMTGAGQHKNLFIRSLASRQQLGGLAAEVWPMSRILLAGYDIVLIETVGVGQSEVDVASMVDTTAYVVQPASGDSIQFIKSGIMEVPDIMVVNKADLGAPAIKAANDLHQVMRRSTQDSDWKIPVCTLSARDRQGIDALVDALEAHRAHLVSMQSLTAGRTSQQGSWAIRQLQEEFGNSGVERLGGAAAIARDLDNRHNLGELLASYNARAQHLRTSTKVWPT